MTDADRKSLNERIALRLGYEKEDEVKWADDPEVELWWQPSPRQGEPPVALPDFTRKWNHAGPLLDELRKQGGITINQSAFVSPWFIVQLDEMELTEAIALAYDAWEEEKE